MLPKTTEEWNALLDKGEEVLREGWEAELQHLLEVGDDFALGFVLAVSFGEPARAFGLRAPNIDDPQVYANGFDIGLALRPKMEAWVIGVLIPLLINLFKTRK